MRGRRLHGPVLTALLMCRRRASKNARRSRSAREDAPHVLSWLQEQGIHPPDRLPPQLQDRRLCGHQGELCYPQGTLADQRRHGGQDCVRHHRAARPTQQRTLLQPIIIIPRGSVHCIRGLASGLPDMHILTWCSSMLNPGHAFQVVPRKDRCCLERDQAGYRC